MLQIIVAQMSHQLIQLKHQVQLQVIASVLFDLFGHVFLILILYPLTLLLC